MARRVEDIPNDPVLVVIDDEASVATFDDWRRLLAGDEPTEVSVDATDVLGHIREHGER